MAEIRLKFDWKYLFRLLLHEKVPLVFNEVIYHTPVHISNVLGPVFLRTTRPDLEKKFTSVFTDDTIPNYLYHCNAQTPR